MFKSIAHAFFEKGLSDLQGMHFVVLICLITFLIIIINHILFDRKKKLGSVMKGLNGIFQFLTVAGSLLVFGCFVFGVIQGTNYRLHQKDQLVIKQMDLIRSKRNQLENQLENQQTKRLVWIHQNRRKADLEKITNQIVKTKMALQQTDFQIGQKADHMIK